MSDGNKRILGDVWINQENLDRQREFFSDIIESYQDKYGGVFDASTLQGLSASDFATAEQGALAINALQSPLRLGKASLIDIEDKQYIYSDAILIDKDTTDPDSSAFDITTISWFDQTENITDALVKLYTMINAGDDEKLDTSVFSKFLSDRFEPVEDQFNDTHVQFIDETTGKETAGFNADLVNGIRPVLITKAKYNQLKNSSNQNDQNIINDWRNVFIFVESLPADYNQPWEYALTDPYSFRIYDGYFQVSNNITDWKDVAPLKDFLQGAGLETLIANYLETAGDIPIGTTSLANSLQLLSTTTINENWEDYPFLSSSLHNNFVYDVSINGNDNYVTETVGSDKFKRVDLDAVQLLKDNEVLNSDGTKRINAIQTALNSCTSTVSSVSNSITNINTRLNTIDTSNNTNATDILDIKNQLSQISNQLSGLADIATWNKDYITDYNNIKYNSQTQIWYNPKLRLCCVYCNGMYYDHKGKKDGVWEECDMKVAYKPKIRYLAASSNPNLLVKIETDGKIYMKYQSAKDLVVHIYFSAFYNY